MVDLFLGVPVWLQCTLIIGIILGLVLFATLLVLKIYTVILDKQIKEYDDFQETLRDMGRNELYNGEK